MVGLLNAGIAGVHHDLGKNGNHPPWYLPFGQGIAQGLLQEIADHALALRAADVQRHRRHEPPGLLVLTEDVADLRAVPMGDHHVQPGSEHGGDLYTRPRHVLPLFGDRPPLPRLEDSVPPEGNHHALDHVNPPTTTNYKL